MQPFREHHLRQFLAIWEKTEGALDKNLYLYFKAHKAIGSKDRKEIADAVYHKVRWKLLPEGKEAADETLPLPVRVSAPQPLWDSFVRSYGEDKAFELLWASNFPAPTTLRVNTALISRDELFKLLNTTLELSLTETSPYGLHVHSRALFFNLDAYKQGFFEVQDEASQLVADKVALKPGQLVLDYCAGSGGKTLAFAHKSQGSGQLYLHDIRIKALQEAKKRLKRARVQNAQILPSEATDKLKKLKKKMDWVLVDAPCSGTGTLRRNPEMKYRFDEDLLRKLQKEQRVIFEKALSFVKPKGHIVYATCSLLQEENELQVEHFLKTYPLKLVEPPFKSLPVQGGMDGLYAAVFEIE